MCRARHRFMQKSVASLLAAYKAYRQQTCQYVAKRSAGRAGFVCSERCRRPSVRDGSSTGPDCGLAVTAVSLHQVSDIVCSHGSWISSSVSAFSDPGMLHAVANMCPSSYRCRRDRQRASFASLLHASETEVIHESCTKTSTKPSLSLSQVQVWTMDASGTVSVLTVSTSTFVVWCQWVHPHWWEQAFSEKP
jgi:hypothetical protein